MDINYFPHAIWLFLLIAAAFILPVVLFPPAVVTSSRKVDPNWLDKQQPRCKHCGARNFWHAFECSTCRYLEPSWNAAADLYPRPLDPKFFAEETPQ